LERDAADCVEFIVRACEQERVVMSLHAEEEAFDEYLDLEDVARGLFKPEVLEIYLSNAFGQRCLVLIKCLGQAVHAVCNLTDSNSVVVVTVYIPRSPDWVNARARGK
jgi:hypothetical protein